MVNDVYISGLGIVSSNATDIKSFTQALQNGYSNFSVEDRDTDKYICAKLSKFDYLNRLNAYNKNDTKLIEKVQRLIRKLSWEAKCTMISVLEAYFEFKERTKESPNDRVGIIIAGNNFAENTICREIGSNIIPSVFLQTIDTYYIGLISELLGFKGTSFVVGGASASGNIGILNACMLIRSNILDSCLVVGPVTEFHTLAIKGFHNMGALGGYNFYDKPNEACRPFDMEHGGFIPGQAAASIFLTEANHILKSKELCKIRKCTEILHCTRKTQPNLETEEKVMADVICDDNVDGVLYINAHGTSTPLGDEVEVQAISNAFGQKLDRVFVNSTKGLVGHCMNSAGIVETIASVLQINNKFIHKNMNLINEINKNENLPKNIIKNIEIENTLNNAFAFNGINTSILIKRD